MPKLRYTHFKIKEERINVYNKTTKRWVKRPRSAVEGDKQQHPTPTPTPGPSHLIECEAEQCLHEESNEDSRPTRYRQKKLKRLAKWKDINSALLKTQTELSAPSDIRCNYCTIANDNPIRCGDCGPTAYYCSEHYANHHKHCPFHCAEIWTGRMFVPFYPETPTLSLTNADADHIAGHHTTTRMVTVIGLRGHRQSVLVQFCSCEPEPVTLLRHGLWASSPETPSMAFQIQLMEWLRALVLDCQVSVKGFVDALATVRVKLDKTTTDEVSRLYQALITDSHSQYMHHHTQLWQLQHLDRTFNSRFKIQDSRFKIQDSRFKIQDSRVPGCGRLCF